MKEKIRETGFDTAGGVPWGTHICLFYQTKEDLIGTLVPYLKAGLENNEFCMWIVSAPLSENDASRAMAEAMPDFEEYLKKGQIEIIPHAEWYLKGGSFNLQRVLSAWIGKLDQALARGYSGIRVTGSADWFEKTGWRDLADYERKVNSAIGEYEILAICTYSLNRYEPLEIIDIVGNHRFILIKRDGKWVLIESTECKRVENLFKESEERYKNLVELTTDIIYISDREGNLIFMNSAGYRMLETTPEEMLGKPWLQWLHPYDREGTLKKFREIIEQGIDISDENRLVSKSGKIINVLHNVRILRNERGEATGVQGIARDITERKRMEEDLQERERFLSNIFSSIPDGIGIIDRDMNIIRVNPTTEKWYPHAAPLVGRKCYKAYHGRSERCEKCPAWRTLETGKSDYEIVPKTGPEGEDIGWLEIYSYPMIDAATGEMRGVIEYVRDITERKRAEKALEAAIAKAEGEKNKTKAIIAAIGDGIIIQDTDYKITYQNQSQSDVYGDHVGEYCYRAYEGRDTICEGCPIELSFRDGKIHRAERSVATGNGTLYTELISSPLRDSTGKIIAGIKVVRNITEQKRAEEAVRESEEKFRSIIEQSGDGIVITDEQGTIIEWNQAEEGIIGLKRTEVVGRPIWDVQFQMAPEERKTPEGYERLKANTLDLIRTGQSHWLGRLWETNAQHPDGTQRSVQVLVFPIKTSKGFMAGSISRDITERKQIEETLRRAHDELEMRVQERTAELVKANEALKAEIAERRRTEELLRESEARYRNLIESARDIIFTISPEGSIISLNPAFETITGWPRAEWLGRDFWPLLHSGELPLAKEVFQRVLNGETPPRLELHTLSKSGDYITVELVIAPQLHSGEVINILGIARDITERKQAQERLQQSEEKYRTLIENTQDGIFIIQDAKIQFANDAFARMAGYTVEDILGKDLRELVAPEDLKMVADRYYRRQAGENTPKDYEFNMLHRDGSTRITANMNVGLITYRSRVASMGTIKDITEKKKLESQLLRAQRMESIGTLAGGITHDVNNVLTPIMLSLELLREKPTDEEGQRLLSIIERSTHRGASLMKQIMSFARGVEGERVALQAEHLISEIDRIARETFPRSIEIRTDVQKNLWSISGDATQLHQVLMNLCVNARDAMPYGGTLCISAENVYIDESYARMNIEARVGPYVVIAVTDTGIGIPAGIIDRIFEPFFTTKEPGKGTGLGLSTALAIVKSHGGFINVYSEVGKETVFKVHLPAIKTTETQKTEELQHQQPPPEGHGELILVVDDEPQVRDVTRETLEKHGYRAITAEDGAEAVALYLLHGEEIKAVLMDTMMPVMDGPASIRALGKINPSIKIIAISGLTEGERFAKTADAHVYAFLVKPYTAERLLKTVREVLNVR